MSTNRALALYSLITGILATAVSALAVATVPLPGLSVSVTWGIYDAVLGAVLAVLFVVVHTVAGRAGAVPSVTPSTWTDASGRVYDLRKPWVDRDGDTWRCTGWLHPIPRASARTSPVPYVSCADYTDDTDGLPLEVAIRRHGPFEPVHEHQTDLRGKEAGR